MRILWVKADKLLPVRNGGNIRSFHILRQLALQHEITLFSYYGGPRDRAYEEALTTTVSGGGLPVHSQVRFGWVEAEARLSLPLSRESPLRSGTVCVGCCQAEVGTMVFGTGFRGGGL